MVNKQHIIEVCTQERQNTKWRFKLITIVTIFAALLKNVPMGCPDSVIPEPFLRNHQVSCSFSDALTQQPYNDNMCLFGAHAVHLHGTTILERSTSMIVNAFCDPNHVHEVSMDNIPIGEDVEEKNIIIYEINTGDGNFVGKLARKSIGKNENIVRFLRYNNQIFISLTSLTFSNAADAQLAINFSIYLKISMSIFYDAIIDSKTFTPKMFRLYERRRLKSCMSSILSTPKTKHYSKSSLFLNLNQFVRHPKN